EDSGDAEALLLGGGRPGEGLLGREGRPYLVGPVDVGQRQRVRGGRDVLRGDLLHPRDRGDDLVELGREMIELIVGERQPGQPGEVLDLVTGDGGHDEKPFLRIDWDSRTILCLLQCPRRQAPGRLPSTGTARDRCIAPTRPGARCAIRSSLRSNLPSDAIAGDEVGAWSRRQPPPHALALLADLGSIGIRAPSYVYCSALGVRRQGAFLQRALRAIAASLRLAQGLAARSGPRSARTCLRTRSQAMRSVRGRGVSRRRTHWLSLPKS